MLVEELPDGAGHGQTQVGVDVDLADSALSGLAELLLGDADGIRHLAAVGVDHLHIVLGNGGGAVEHNGEPGQALDHLVQNVKAQRRRNQLALFVAGALGGGELIGADGDGQGVAAGLGDELLHLFGTGVVGLLGGDIDLVLYAGQSAQLGLNNNAVVVGVLHHLLGDLNVLGKGLGAGVNHD